MSPRIWCVSVFLLLLAIGFIASYLLLTLLGLFGGASWWAIFPLAGSLLLFATCGWILLWPRLGSWMGLVLLLCIACWPVVTTTSDVAAGRSVDFLLLGLLLPIGAGFWLTIREAFGFTSHKQQKKGIVYTAFAGVVIVGLPALVFANFYSTHGQTEVREFPTGFHGQAVVIWNEDGYSALPVRDGKLIEHFPNDGVIVTSTQLREGWAKDEMYFYDSTGRHRANPEAISVHGIGEFNDSKHHMKYSELFVGPKEENADSNFDEQQRKIHEILRRVHPDIAE
jgi:hypothetical protein